MAATHADADYWAGYRFRPRLIAANADAAWVVEDHLPLVIRIDGSTGAVGEPQPVGRKDEATRGAHEIVATREAVWIRWNDGITRLDPKDGAERWLPLSAASLAAAEDAAWALSGDGRVVRIDPEGGDYVTLGEGEVRRHTIGVGHGAVWTLTWTSVPGGSTLSRIDPLSGRPVAQAAIEGSPRRLLIDNGAVWVRVWRHGMSDAVEELLVRVDPETVAATGEILVSPTGSGGPVLDGVLWAPAADPYAHELRGAPSELRRIDAAGGGLMSVVAVPGSVSALIAGAESVWGCLERRDEPAAVIELTEDGHASRVFDVQHVDVSGHVPTSGSR